MSKVKKVKDHFDNTGNYLNNNLVIEYRRNVIKEHFSDKSGLNIVDIGCGNGQISFQLLENNRITFIDISEKMLDLVRSSITPQFEQNATILLGDFNEMFFQNKFDLALCFGVLAHVDNVEISLLKLKEAINEKGIIIIQFTNYSRLISKTIRLMRFIKKLFKKSYQYKINYIRNKDMNRFLDSLQLTYTKKEYYWASFPGFIFLPVSMRRFIFSKILNNSILSKLGGECIIFIKKKNN